MSFDNPGLLLFAAIAIPCAFLAVRNWRPALFGVFVLLVFEGALRKWVFPWAQAQIYLVKDAILLAVYLGFILDGRRHQPALKGVDLIKIVLVVSFIFGCIELLNPNSPSILVGLIGLKAYFLYAPVAFILPYAFKSREHLFDLIRRYLIMAIPVAVLGFIQIAAGPESSLNAYVSHSENAAALVLFGDESGYIVRTSGTFSFISGYTAFLTFIAFLAIGYNMGRGWRVKGNIAPMLALTLVVGAMFTTGSRAPVYTLIATAPVILWLAVSGRILASQTAVRLCMLLPVIAIVALTISPRAVEAFAQRAGEGDLSDLLARIFQPVYEIIEALPSTPPLGMGIGTTHASALTIMGAEWPWWLQDLMVEAEMARVMVEIGVIGLLLIWFMRFLIAAFALRCARSFKDPAYRALGIVLVVHLALGIITPVILNVTAGLYYWGALGLVLAMRRLEQSAATEVGTIFATSRPRIGPSAVHAKQRSSRSRRVA
jgi:hypothetical protein